MGCSSSAKPLKPKVAKQDTTQEQPMDADTTKTMEDTSDPIDIDSDSLPDPFSDHPKKSSDSRDPDSDTKHKSGKRLQTKNPTCIKSKQHKPSNDYKHCDSFPEVTWQT